MNPYVPVPSDRLTVTVNATVEIRCKCGDTIRLHSTIPGINSTTVCPRFTCRREYRVEETRVVERHCSAPCPDASPHQILCEKGGYQDSRCDLWQECSLREGDAA
jgi:hypothetical protein